MTRYWENWEQMGKEFLSSFMYNDEEYLKKSATGIICDFINSLKDEQRNILDIGCGPGIDCSYYMKNIHGDYRYTGIDITPTSIEVANERCIGDNIQLFVGDIFALSNNQQISDKYNVVIIKGVLEHLPNSGEKNYMIAISNAIAKSSKYIIIVLNHYCLDGETRTEFTDSKFIPDKEVFFYNNFFAKQDILEVDGTEVKNHIEITAPDGAEWSIVILEKIQ